MAIQFLKSEDGKTFTLTGGGLSVGRRYKTIPQFHNQVLGDLIRLHWQTYPDVKLLVPSDFIPVARTA